MKDKAKKRAMATATRVASGNEGNGDDEEGGGQVTAMRVMVVAPTVVGEDEGNGDGNEGDRQQRG